MIRMFTIVAASTSKKEAKMKKRVDKTTACKELGKLEEKQASLFSAPSDELDSQSCAVFCNCKTRAEQGIVGAQFNVGNDVHRNRLQYLDLKIELNAKVVI